VEQERDGLRRGRRHARERDLEVLALDEPRLEPPRERGPRVGVAPPGLLDERVALAGLEAQVLVEAREPRVERSLRVALRERADDGLRVPAGRADRGVGR